MAGTVAATGAAAFPMPSIAQNAPMKVGVLTPKTGVLAAGGIHNEEGITTFLKEKDYKVGGRKIELIIADTGGNPAGAKTKAIELVERDKVDMIMGPFAAFEHLAIVDYLAQHKMPTFAYNGAEDVTQRKANPFIVRTTSSAAQCLYPMADYAFKEMKVKRAITMMDDFAFGYEQVGGFQRPFDELGGRVVKKLWSPLNTPDYTPYISQIADCDVVCNGLTGSNPLKFVKQYKDLGGSAPLVGGLTFADDIITRSFGDEADGIMNAIPYSLDYDTPANKSFLASIRKYYGEDVPIGFYSAAYYVNGQILEAALQKTGGKSDDPEAFIKAVRSVSLTDTPRGAISFDDYGNVITNVFIRRVVKKNGKMVNTTVKIYPKVTQFWTYDPKWFLAQPVYSRDYPPLKS
ncbi:MAG TPA: ABC transporter substrate-binding protein [Xanthobacteraceae bacterium]|nr:ABC transporter substrate-binding protein [Xanthobacteraceae bacterium]